MFPGFWWTTTGLNRPRNIAWEGILADSGVTVGDESAYPGPQHLSQSTLPDSSTIRNFLNLVEANGSINVLFLCLVFRPEVTLTIADELKREPRPSLK